MALGIGRLPKAHRFGRRIQLTTAITGRTSMESKMSPLYSLIDRTKSMGTSNRQGAQAENIVKALPLSHATSLQSFSSMCKEKCMYSKAELIKTKKCPPPTDPTPEQQLGTDKFVFFFPSLFQLSQHSVRSSFPQRAANHP